MPTLKGARFFLPDLFGCARYGATTTNQMIASSTITAIAEQLTRGRSMRSIAREFAVSFFVVSKVKRGGFATSHKRCQQCGAKVKTVSIKSEELSCLACALRKPGARR